MPSALTVVRNSKGEPIVLNAKEEQHAEWMARQINDKFGNSLGYEVQITTLTSISKKISEQKFYEIPPADYIPIVVGQGTWSSNITTYRSFDVAGEFEDGIINTGGQNARLAAADAAVDALNILTYNWNKSIGWSIFDLQLAAKSGNWDLVTAKEKARKRNYDLGIQRIAFLGARGLNGSSGTCLGLLNQSGITTNTTTITKSLKSMTPAELKTFQELIVTNYRDNTNRTAWPTHFVIPESDYLGLASQASPEFPIKSTLQLLEEAFKTTCQNPSFKILPLSYADAAYHADVSTIAGKQVYTLLNYDEESLVMNVPLQYTNTLANSLDNFNFQNCAYSQFTGVLAVRPLELMYFTY